MIEVRNLRKAYENVLALDNVSFEVGEGEAFAFLGPNGAGKTTTIKILMGFIYPDLGYAKMFGKDVIRHGKKIRKRIGYLPEEMGFYDQLSAYENLNFFARLFGIPKAEREKRIEELLERVDLLERKDSPVREYSHGMKQRLGIAQSLINDPDLLIYDEPTSGLDPRSSYEIRELIKGFVKEGKTLFLSSHLLYEVQQICRTVAIINKGKIVVKDEIKNLSKMISGKSIKVTIRCLNLDEELVDKAKKVKGVRRVRTDGNNLIAMVEDEETIASMISSMVKAGGKITSVKEESPGLEEIFLKLTGD
ncbi:MAG: ABC transporter ATP-binding protein [Thermoplasmata archaeon]|nr:MAG: ABC transporter ATP-binding protein [Thermoplasmata archaeon]KAA0014782.1 MAG: ABC transporter ATP-binding protein [Thermoplasmata archaeon]